MPEDFTALYKQALEGLRTGGKKLEASLQEIEEGKRQAIAGGQQALTGGGLAGTTVMGAVPLAAEKGAARKRLAARGEAEQTYLTTLASFAAFAQRGEEAKKQREWEAEQLRYKARLAGEQERAQTLRARETATRAQREQGWMFQPLLGGGGGAGGAQQFPSLYGAGDGGVPDWTGGGAGGYQRMDIQMGETMWGDPNVRDAAGNIIGTRQTTNVEEYKSRNPQFFNLGQAVTTGAQPSVQPGAGTYAPRSPAESIAAIRAGYYGSQGQQLKPYTRADAERLGY